MTSFASRCRSGLLPFRPRIAGLWPMLVAGALVAGPAAHAADTRIFLIENSDGYGVDTCLANGEPCGAEVANAWCRTHDYGRALDFGRIAVTGSTGITTLARGEGEAKTPVVAIACTR